MQDPGNVSSKTPSRETRACHSPANTHLPATGTNDLCLVLGSASSMFSPLSYLDWIGEHHRRVDVDLASSVLRGNEIGYAALLDRQVPGDRSLDEHIADHYPDVNPAMVEPTAGATHANFLVAMAALSRSIDAGISTPEIVVESPGYEPLVETPRGLGARITRLSRPRCQNYGVDLAALEKSLSEGTALVTISNRHNPSGRLLDRDRLAEIAGVVQTRDALLLVDEVYAPLVRSEKTDPAGAIGGPTAAGLPNTIITQSLTKFFGFPGLRCGWLIANEPIRSYVETMTSHLPVLSQPSMDLAGRILTNDRFEERSRSLLERNYDRLAAFADRDTIVGHPFPGSSFAFLGHKSADGDAVVEAAKDAGVLVVPGRFFGAPNRFRVCACRPTDTVERGIGRLGAVVDGL